MESEEICVEDTACLSKIDMPIQRNEYSNEILQDDMQRMYVASLKTTLDDVDWCIEYWKRGRTERDWLFRDIVKDIVFQIGNKDFLDDVMYACFKTDSTLYRKTLKEKLPKDIILWATGGKKLL